jgi:NADP-dependent 3-hydroxy acid dehydrogenase YdfG
MSRSSSGFDFSDRVVVVTGGTRGIGRAIAESFLGAGAEVLVCARTEPASLPAADGRKASFVYADLREPDQAAAVIDSAVSAYGHLDVLVNNAGGSPAADAATVSPRFVAKVVALNLLAPFYISQPANAVMQGQEDGGVIVNIGSVAAHQPEPGTAAYAAAKAGLLQLTRALALEWAPHPHRAGRRVLRRGRRRRGGRSRPHRPPGPTRGCGIRLPVPGVSAGRVHHRRGPGRARRRRDSRPLSRCPSAGLVGNRPRRQVSEQFEIRY